MVFRTFGSFRVLESTQRLHRKSTGKRQPPPPERTVDTTAADVRELKAELANVRADAGAAVALAVVCEPSGLGGSVDRLRSCAYSFVFTGCYNLGEMSGLEC